MCVGGGGGGSSPTSGNAGDLSQYDPGCRSGCKIPTLTLVRGCRCASVV